MPARPLKFQAQLKRDHAWTAVATQSDAEQAGRRRGGVGERSESGLRGGCSRNSGQHPAGKTKVRMVEDIEELAFDSELYPLVHRKPFCKIEVTPEEIGAAQGVAAEITKLAMLWVVAPEALSRAGINRRDEGVRIEPLDRARLGYAGNGMMHI